MGADVFNALDVTENKTIFEDLKFGIGDGNLHYYFFNWRCPELPSEKVSSWQDKMLVVMIAVSLQVALILQ